MAGLQAEDGSTEHVPVLYQPILEWLRPLPDQRFVDGTLGGGGHAEGILARGARLLGVDRDAEAVRAAQRRLAEYASRAVLRQASYRSAPRILAEIGWNSAEGILLDLGLSSLQLADPQRGFAFRQDGPLDMRFDRSGGETAADLVNTLPEEEIAGILFRYGEERRARRIAREILHRRPIESTRQLAEAVAAAVGFRPGGRLHPATRTFQALRIAVNGELEELESGLPALMDCLEVGGRMAVISFHSLEDRIVKRTFRRACGRPVRGEMKGPGPDEEVCFRELTPKPVLPDEGERMSNQRSRSAKLRVIERIRPAFPQAGGEADGGGLGKAS
jgi:16S rRNA (cytosine1402-N4)-methyltransferase